ncbi:hypothetical protein COO91_01559 [Nostoc flagelliforme CCNUN1]|uniref:Uncharacterized protein n=1 Tax=Nostoc flagelliforme CCNUN1 TaxID=2038116 RepID=A0A2K8SJN9_9NOSO|nr:hypothetical protein [Nostoc flagelliforme]AUB35669.1 hypothetical protein COO91_01559 [Nostoc flagelliforme CCNUN1]
MILNAFCLGIGTMPTAGYAYAQNEITAIAIVLCILCNSLSFSGKESNSLCNQSVALTDIPPRT